MKIWDRLKSRKGLTGADVAAAITVIVLTVGIVTMIYVNTLNKSKDNLRYANATRIATSIMENIQKKTYEEVLAVCATNNKVEQANNGKVFDTNILNGYTATVTLSVPGTPDVARDVTVEVKYKTSTTYRTITLNSVIEKELMDIANAPDISLMNGYEPLGTTSYYYPVVFDTSTTPKTYTIVTTDDINWYNYETGKGAIIYKTDTNLPVGTKRNYNSGDDEFLYVWVPRFVTNGSSSLDFLYRASDYKIVFDNSTNVIGYRKDRTQVSASAWASDKNPFASGDGLSGVWLNVKTAKTSGGYSSTSAEGKIVALITLLRLAMPG